MYKNNLIHWFGALRDSGVRVPETVVTLTNVNLFDLLDDVLPDGFGDFVEEFGQSIASLPGPPYFIRTGHTSAKHLWNQTCFLESINDLPSHVVALVETSALHGLPVDTWVAREFIRARPRFRAFGGTPITREHRFFFKDHKVICHHPLCSGVNNWVAGIIQGADFTQEFIAAHQGIGRDDTLGSHHGPAPTAFGRDGLAIGISMTSDLIGDLYYDLGLPFLDAKKRNDQFRYLGSLHAFYSPVEQRLTVLDHRGNPFRIRPAKRGVQQVNGSALNLFDLNHADKSSVGILALEDMDRKTSIRVEDARAIGQDGWLVFHERHYPQFQGDCKRSQVVCAFLVEPPIRNADVPGWRYHLKCIHDTPPSHIGHLVNQTNRVASEFDGAWSVDWLKCSDGEWLAIDMSLYEDSWHWPGCPNVVPIDK